jgi:phage gpG-like protein
MTTVLGLPELSRNIARLKKIAGGPNMRAALMAGAAVVEAAAKVNIRQQGLIDEGRLRASIAATPVTDNEVWIGTNVIYAAIHEFGGVIRAKNAPALFFFWEEKGVFVRTQQVTIPARPYLRPALLDNKAEILNAISLELGQAITGEFGG